MKNLLPAIPLLLLFASPLSAGEGKHLFILSGQSNMARLKPSDAFTPAVEKEFGKDNVIVVHSAQGGRPIRSWYKEWKPAVGPKPEKNGELYGGLMKSVEAAVAGQGIATVTFLWMQGENDAKEHSAVYGESLRGLVKQLSDDLGREDVHIVIGRLSDYGARRPGWNVIREAQVKVAEEAAKGAWVDTDDLNDGRNAAGKELKDDLHYTEEGYITFGKRLADAAISLIRG